MPRIRTILPLTGLLCLLAHGAALGNRPEPAEIVVLSTLHQLHEEVEGYGYEELSRIIEALEPDILAVELTPTDVETRREQSVKREYPRAVFPLLERHDYRLVPLEPPQPLYGEIVSRFRQAQEALARGAPCRAEALNAYSEALYGFLMEEWDSAADVNSGTTDALFEVKHAFQSELYGPLEAEAWEDWNRHFLEQVMAAARENPGRRILVLVGAEHGYWLRDRLARSGVQLLDTPRLLEAAAK